MTEQSSLSDELRRAREARGESIEQVHQQTGIAVTILQGLESGNFEVVEPVYARLAIDHYATYLGLDGPALEARLRSEVAASRPPPVDMVAGTTPAGPTPTPSPVHDALVRQPPARLAAAAVLVVVVVAIVLYLLSGDGPSPASGQTRPSTPQAPATSAVAGTRAAERLTQAEDEGAVTEAGDEAVAEQAGTEPPPPGQESDESADTPSPVVEQVAEPTTAQTTPDTDGTSETPAEPDRARPAETVTETTDAIESELVTTRTTGSDAAATSEATPEPTAGVRQPTSAQADGDQQVDMDQQADGGQQADSAPESTDEPPAIEEPDNTTRIAASDSVDIIAPQVEPTPGSLVLEVEAIDSTWVQIQWDDDDGIVETIPSGERRTFSADRVFLVRAGRAHGVHFHFQGQLLGDGRLGDPTKVLRFRATATGVELLGPDLEPIAQVSPDSTETPSRDRP